jgi:hypothetical protein
MAAQDSSPGGQGDTSQDMVVDYSMWASMMGEDYDERQTWAHQDYQDVLATEAKAGTITEEAYILNFTLSSAQKLSPDSNSILLFDTNTVGTEVDALADAGEIARQSFGQLGNYTKTTGVGLTTDEQTAVDKYFLDGTNRGGAPPILTWATVNDASLTTIQGDLDAYYGEYAQTREVNQKLNQWTSPGGPTPSRIWTLGNLVNISTTMTNYAATEDGGARYRTETGDQNTQQWSEGRLGYGDGELVYLSTIAGFKGFSNNDAYTQALGWVNSRVDGLIDQMLVPDVGNQIVNRTVDQGILKKT